ncbi:hypothetical protein HMPREF0591_1825 [Mycobacterium parascrofulaceum ATCC BAA-614]|uniref:Uncharacterized protein n=1 Tax=Mycobacterium parascrofulaceum ATCC BAA-614 TaxID=525368 RepID=D5P6N1_9MYCO|nr:hypothetical protein HMPREF0591_1825 [Mycobacterium parascrofulaceum ATCC BAA-614]
MVAKQEEGSNTVKIRMGLAAVALLVAVMVWLLASHTLDWVLSTGLAH